MAEKHQYLSDSSSETPPMILPLFPMTPQSPPHLQHLGRLPDADDIPNGCFLSLAISATHDVPNFPTTKTITPHQLLPNDFFFPPTTLPDMWNELRWLYHISPKIEKTLTPRDVGNNHSLMLSADDVVKKFFPLMDKAWADQCCTPVGVRCKVLDLEDTSTSFTLVLKKHTSFVLMENWKKNFVVRKQLRASHVVRLALVHGYLIFES